MQSQWCSLWRGSVPDKVAACKPQAGEQTYRWPAQWRSGGGLEGTAVIEGTKASARFHALWRGSDRDAVARQAACVVLIPTTRQEQAA